MSNIRKPEGTSKSKKLCASLSSDDVQVVKGLADLERVSVSEIVRRGIVLYNASIVTTSEDVLKKYIEAKTYIREHEEESASVLENGYNGELTVDGYRYYLARKVEYRYSEYVRDFIQFVGDMKKKDILNGGAKIVKDINSVYSRKATPPVVLAS